MGDARAVTYVPPFGKIMIGSTLNRLPRFLVWVPLCVIVLAGFGWQSFRAQEKSRRQEFGASLKQLKWDEQRQEVVDTERRPDAPEQDNVLRVETALAVFDILVLDAQRQPVPGLKKDDFVIAEDGKPQQPASLLLGDGSSVPRSIVLIMDYSGSLRPFIESSVAAARLLVDKLKRNDRMAIVTDDVSLLVDFTTDKGKLKDGLNSLRKHAKSGRPGRSEQYSALLATLKELVANEERPIIIFQTDGDELGKLRNAANAPPGVPLPAQLRAQFKEYSLEDISLAAAKTRTTIYSVIPGLRFADASTEEDVERAETLFDKLFHPQEDNRRWRGRRAPGFDSYLRGRAQVLREQQLALANIARLTGGWAEFLEEPQQAAGIYDRIFSGIERRYILTYYPTNTERNGKLRQVEIKIRDHPEYSVWGKRSYYAYAR